MKKLCVEIARWLYNQQTNEAAKRQDNNSDGGSHKQECCMLDEETCEDTESEDNDRTIEYIVIHRITVEEATGLPDDKIGLMEFFTNHPEGVKATGGKFPYHFLVLSDGDVEQVEPCDVVTPHVAKWNKVSVGIGVIGDFRKNSLGQIQKGSLFQLCCELQQQYPRATIVAHDGLRGGSKHKNKVCPGQFIDVNQLKKSVVAYIRTGPTVA